MWASYSGWREYDLLQRVHVKELRAERAESVYFFRRSELGSACNLRVRWGGGTFGAGFVKPRCCAGLVSCL